MEAKVIPSHPNRELTHIESINKKPRDAQQLIFRESKTDMAKKDRTNGEERNNSEESQESTLTAKGQEKNK